MGILKETQLAARQILADMFDLFCLCSAPTQQTPAAKAPWVRRMPSLLRLP